MKKVNLIMPCYQNQEQKAEALKTLTINTEIPFDIYKFPTEDINYGWMGACNMGIKASEDYEYIVLSNDDILVPGMSDWAKIMLDIMDSHPDLGALSVVSYNIGGWAKLSFNSCMQKKPYEVPYCSFFFVMLRNEAVKKTGLLDENLPGGDDWDYCFRLKEEGYKIAITPQVFIWHHYGQTGKKVYSDWDNQEYADNITRAMIRKHGFSKFVYNRHNKLCF